MPIITDVRSKPNTHLKHKGFMTSTQGQGEGQGCFLPQSVWLTVQSNLP